MTSEPIWKAEDVIRITRGRCLHEQVWQASGVSIDSRTVKPGDLYIALPGNMHDGHDHVATAFASGASAALVTRQPSQTPPDAPMIFVDDTYMSLCDLGRAGRERATGAIIAVTGSVGKTGTKEMLRMALSAVGNTYAGNEAYKEPWGLPLSLANLPSQADYGIFELGLTHPGELADLARLLRPDIAVITTVDAVDLERFKSLEAIADAHAEILTGMSKNGVVILNRNTPYFPRLAKTAKKQGLKKILSFALDGKADAYLVDCALTSEGSAVNAMLAGYNIHYSIGSQGLHLVQNSLAALLTATTASGKKDECARPLSRYKQLPGRGLKSSVALSDGNSFTLIDDSYDASPASVRAAVYILSQMIPTAAGRRILILGDMQGLGEASSTLHSGLAEAIESARIDGVYCCGPLMRGLYEALPNVARGGYVRNSELLATLIADQIQADDIVLVKGSKDMRMNVVIDALKDLDAQSLQKMVS